MANIKITQLPELTIPAGADLLEIVDDVAGTPTSKKIALSNLMKEIPIAIPGAIGGTTPAAGAFTILKASTDPTDEHGVGDRGYYSKLVANDGIECIAYS